MHIEPDTTSWVETELIAQAQVFEALQWPFATEAGYVWIFSAAFITLRLFNDIALFFF